MQRRPAPHARPLPALLSVPGEEVKRPQKRAFTHPTLPGHSSCTSLTHFNVQVSRGLLPDTGSEYEGDGGNISDALEFLLLNFTEMNKLWVRMQHQGSGKDRCACYPHFHAVLMLNCSL